MSRAVIVVVVVFLTAMTARAGEPTDVVDCAADVRLFDSHFARYGYQPTRTIAKEPKGVRIRLPARAVNVVQTGLYSYFSLAGDFEVTADYELIDLPPPQGGYGVSCGIGVDTLGPGGMVAL